MILTVFKATEQITYKDNVKGREVHIILFHGAMRFFLRILIDKFSDVFKSFIIQITVKII